jgi:hypothetical protein
MLKETAVVYAGSGQTITMTENSVPISVAHIQGKDTVLCDYVGLQPGKLKLS